MSKQPDIKLITTDDGSHSLYVSRLNETYHSFHGAVQESVHVFIKSGLQYKTQQATQPSCSIFEVGLGTGLNALLTAEYAHDHQLKINFTSIEAYPLKAELTDHLNYCNYLKAPEAPEWFSKIHQSKWNIDEPIHNHFLLKKIDKKLEEFSLPEAAFDIIYFDAFAPSKQEELWSYDILNKIVQAMKPDAVFVTYCAKGQLKRDLKNLGLTVNSLPGPPGKKEMVQAVKQ
ncbi:tRNA (5-methylaminomethyl-2-thiouridine)(34)-methyltransferase MnmD [Fulvivirga sediminis]|uniref:tRNA (5-methylaminomethyl-2-thiouridine)(34)-methyltransferase MnmD n=1 Tax=Fulvivirga sediminis TaxID=2803949 RepID=A0A937K1U2_9BACT|nr:tRNA (5-methylaminomethyl-2-thiouridine)(34)-methyltransferase MnmD [Fulvivirga sediminis]MBL3657057.1 tRNA (5-methylaminomethyl-2-thiouridine)(34)-methyltransferase MnmD [Fulvivirga sediminis]